jgi:hypothetical protein
MNKQLPDSVRLVREVAQIIGGPDLLGVDAELAARELISLAEAEAASEVDGA